ncbi:MAG: site-2 protease family protein [Thermodesulfobacteriota bacterium]|jgi:Zn-dependent protease
MGLLKLLTNDPLAFALVAIPLLFSVIIHEVAHGWVAYRMGDPTAKWSGRLTLNPLKHLDPVGTLMLFLAGFGWAKPVPVNFNNLSDKRKGLIFVSSAGIVANILFAFIALLFFRLFSTSFSGITHILVYYVVQINITLAALNLIPIPPLDGSKILMGIAWERTPYFLARLEPYGFFIIIGFLYLGILDPLIGLFRWMIGTLIGILLP